MESNIQITSKQARKKYEEIYGKIPYRSWESYARRLRKKLSWIY